MSIEYAGIYIHLESNNKLIKLCDTLPFLKPQTNFTESEVKKTIKAFLGTMNNDENNKKTLAYSTSYFLFHHSDVYFIFIARTEISEDKMENFYMDLKKDLGLVCRNNLKSLQEKEISEGQFQNSLEPTL